MTAKTLNTKAVKAAKAAALVAGALLFAGQFNTVFANNYSKAPSFPSCESKIFSEKGDWAHYDHGVHGIVGVANMEGKDDVYSLSDGNFLQCFCPVEGTEGIQSNWWNANRAGLSKEKIKKYVSEGWFKENGSGWNLYNDTYLVKNKTFSCAQETPTPTPAVTTVTPTPGAQSRCFDLEAAPLEGSAPLTVQFTAHADDPNSGGKIKEYKFDFGDASGGQPQVWSQTDKVAYHRYEKSGEYTAKVDIQDNAGIWRGSDDCRVTIKVGDTPTVLGAKTPTSLPSTGMTAILAAVVPTLAGVGYHLYRRFKLI